MTKKKPAPAKPARTFEIAVPLLRAALADVASVVERRVTVPILSHVLVTVTQSSLTLTGTDLEAWCERHVTLDGDADPMTLTVEAGTLTKILGKLPDDATARLDYADGKLTVSAGRSRFTLPTLPAEDFVAYAKRDWVAEFEMQAVMLAGGLSTVAFAASTEETRYYLNGVFLHAPDGADLRFAATDGHRLARGVMVLPDGAQEMPDIIIPSKIVKVLTGLLGRHEGLVDVRLNKSAIRVEIGSTTLQAKLIDGQFPDYTRVIPASNTGLLAIDREALIAAVNRVTTVSTDKVRAVKCDLAGQVLVVSVTCPEKGMATEELPCEWQGGPLTIGFNSRFLLDVLGHLTADQIEATFSDSAGPVLLRDREDAAATFVVMPMRV